MLDRIYRILGYCISRCVVLVGECEYGKKRLTMSLQVR